jgi:hypothetical protein
MIVRVYRVLFWGCERLPESIVLEHLSFSCMPSSQRALGISTSQNADAFYEQENIVETTTFKGVVEIDVTLVFIQFYRVLFWGCERLPESIVLEHL